jgi:hypothetical protein
MQDICQRVLEDGGGMITCGGHLGVFVAEEKYITQTPPGWVFVDVSTADVAMVREALEHAKAGRFAWPERVVDVEPTTKQKRQQRRKKRKSQ